MKPGLSKVHPLTPPTVTDGDRSLWGSRITSERMMEKGGRERIKKKKKTLLKFPIHSCIFSLILLVDKTYFILQTKTKQLLTQDTHHCWKRALASDHNPLTFTHTNTEQLSSPPSAAWHTRMAACTADTGTGTKDRDKGPHFMSKFEASLKHE